uniref:Uncharacterized protein n=1 Tax=Physcomitrium patens TaxID=3218 RepID=A0A2K1JC08_PHYPA|nr:hypothetical protein PHYPA_019329 [Physcomitrium patens]
MICVPMNSFRPTSHQRERGGLEERTGTKMIVASFFTLAARFTLPRFNTHNNKQKKKQKQKTTFFLVEFHPSS